jgi:hypothetical protein
MTEELSTCKVRTSSTKRLARCDDEGRKEVIIIGGLGASEPVSPANISGTITTGGTAQVLAAANADRRGWWLRNNSAGSLWVSDMTTAVQSQPSLEIKSGELYEAVAGGVSANALSIIGAITGQSFTARAW